MIQRRFVNLVFDCMRSRTHSLHRLDAAKHLFYPSTAEAEAANAKAESNNGGGGGKTKPPRIKRLRRLPEPSMRFFQFPFPDADEEEPDPWPSMDDAFMLVSPGTSEATILHATEHGRAVFYDADARAASAADPCFPKPMGRDPIAFSVPGSGRFIDDGFFFDEKESLHVMRSGIKKPPQNGGCSGDFVVLDLNHPFEWQQLPPPPFPAGYYAADIGVTITSSAVVDGGRTICVSSENKGGAESTYCFDTAARQWRHAGDWALPFYGRAEYVPELETWIGLSPYPRCNLCASDLSAAAMDGDAHQQAPTLQHVWDDFTLPPEKRSSVVLNRRFPHFVLRRWKEWSAPLGLHLVNLGSGRFCVFKVFDIRRGEQVGFHVDDTFGEEMIAVITGVEVVRGEDGELRMVKHKARRCPFPGLRWSVF